MCFISIDLRASSVDSWSTIGLSVKSSGPDFSSQQGNQWYTRNLRARLSNITWHEPTPLVHSKCKILPDLHYNAHENILKQWQSLAKINTNDPALTQPHGARVQFDQSAAGYSSLMSWPLDFRSRWCRGGDYVPLGDWLNWKDLVDKTSVVCPRLHAKYCQIQV